MNARWRPLRPASRPATSPGLAACWPRPTPGRSTSSSARESTCCAPSSRSSPAAAPTRPRSCWPPPAGSSRWTSRSRGRRTWTRSPRRCSAPGSTAASGCPRSRRPPEPRRGHRMRSRRTADLLLDALVALADDYDTAVPRCREAVQRLAGEQASPRNGCAGCGRVASSPSRSGTTNMRTRCRTPASRSPARRGRSASSRSPSARARRSRCSAETSPPPPRRSPRPSSVQEATGIRAAPYGALILSAWRGRRPETTSPDRDHGARGRGPRRGHRTGHQCLRARRPLQRARPL